jgi:hypothetical protein
MNKHIYVMSYIGGFSGEFIASQIAQDSNFKNIPATVDESINRYHLQDEIREAGIINLRQIINSDKFRLGGPKKSKIIPKINEIAGNQNYIIPTHIYISDGYDFPIDPARLKTVRLYSQNFDFYYTLAVIKTFLSKYPADQFSLPKLEKIMMTSTDGSVIPKAKILLANVKERGFFYHIEKLAFRNRTFGVESVISAHYDRMKSINHSSLQAGYSNWDRYLNIDDLYDNFSSANAIWKSAFNLEDDLNSQKFQDYNQKNKDLVEQTFNKNLQTFLNGDLISELSNYVKTKISLESTLD